MPLKIRLRKKSSLRHLPINQYVTRNPLPNHHAIPPPRNVNSLETGQEEFDPSILITLADHLVPAYHIPEDDYVCIVGGTEDICLEGGEEEEEFEQDLIEEVVSLEWWDPTNPVDGSIWYKEEKATKPIKEDD